MTLSQRISKSRFTRTTANSLLWSGLLAAVSASTGCKNSIGPEEADLASDQVAAGMTAEIVQMLEEAIQDEFHAEMIYRRVLADFGQIRPFSNIVNAEVRHAASLALLFDRYGLEVPESKWNLENVPAFDSVREACQAAARAEIANIALYDVWLAGTLPEDVRFVFENNRRASADKHLPAFNRCSGH